ncbi:unnamed protein product [Amoebophrya sp. A25]|nr:unnamed protein product [Amoebophrya sp. A25]|eukprot:GSA25T00024591001.1
MVSYLDPCSRSLSIAQKESRSSCSFPYSSSLYLEDIIILNRSDYTTELHRHRLFARSKSVRSSILFDPIPTKNNHDGVQTRRRRKAASASTTTLSSSITTRPAQSCLLRRFLFVFCLWNLLAALFSNFRISFTTTTPASCTSTREQRSGQGRVAQSFFAGGPLLAAASGVSQCGLSQGSLSFVSSSRRNLIVNGNDATGCEWPWHVALLQIHQSETNIAGGVQTRLSWSYRCGGSLLDDTHVLTAAHCVEGLNAGDTLHVLAGTHVKDIASMSEAELHRHVVAVQTVHIHPQYYSSRRRLSNAEEDSPFEMEDTAGAKRKSNTSKEDGEDTTTFASQSLLAKLQRAKKEKAASVKTRRLTTTGGQNLQGNLLFDYAVLGLVAPGNNYPDDSKDALDTVLDLFGGGDDFTLSTSNGGSSNNLNQNFIPQLAKEPCSGSSTRRSLDAQVLGRRTSTSPSSTSPVPSSKIGYVCIPDAPLDSEVLRRKYEGVGDLLESLTVFADNVGQGYLSGSGPNNLGDYECVISGWGQTDSSGSMPKTLQETSISLDEKCSEWSVNGPFESVFLNANGYDDNIASVLCGKGRSGGTSGGTVPSTACAGDSGGPLLCRKRVPGSLLTEQGSSHPWIQYGVISQGRDTDMNALNSCAPDVEVWFADTFFARSWILEKAQIPTQPLEYNVPSRATARALVLACFVFLLVVLLFEVYSVFRYGRCRGPCCRQRGSSSGGGGNPTDGATSAPSPSRWQRIFGTAATTPDARVKLQTYDSQPAVLTQFPPYSQFSPYNQHQNGGIIYNGNQNVGASPPGMVGLAAPGVGPQFVRYSSPIVFEQSAIGGQVHLQGRGQHHQATNDIVNIGPTLLGAASSSSEEPTAEQLEMSVMNASPASPAAPEHQDRRPQHEIDLNRDSELAMSQVIARAQATNSVIVVRRDGDRFQLQASEAPSVLPALRQQT